VVDVYLGGALDKVTAAENATPPELDVVFEDDSLLVVDKPAGLPTAATRETDRNNLFIMFPAAYVESAAPGTPIGSRDERTSGRGQDRGERPSLVRAFSNAHHRARVSRRDARGIAGCPHGRISHRGPAAVHRFRAGRAQGGATLAEARLETGRTHQIRVPRIGPSVIPSQAIGATASEPGMSLRASPCTRSCWASAIPR